MILVLGGTGTTHEVVGELVGRYWVISVATDFGFEQFNRRYPGCVTRTQFTPESLEAYIVEQGVTEIIDTTHPFAVEISRIARKAAADAGIRYVNRVRDTGTLPEYSRLHVAESYEHAARITAELPVTRVLLTIGSRRLHHFQGVLDRSWVRVLPVAEALDACKKLGIGPERIIALQGPFSAGFNKSLMDELAIDCLVTKQSGGGSGYIEKCAAAMETGADLVIIRPAEENTFPDQS